MLTAATAGLLDAVQTADAAPASDTHPLLEEGPCDDCRHAARCATQHLACDAFAVWVAGRRSIYWQTAARQPMRERYAAVFKQA